MSRSHSLFSASGSVSALAMVTFLSACSQPASHATVDLSSSNSGNFQTAQGFSPVTGQPVYNPTSGFGPQPLPQLGQYQPNSQFAALNVPGNQVASLGNDTFGILDQLPQQSRQQFSSPVQSAPNARPQQLLSTPQFQREAQSVNRAFEESARLAVAAPFSPAPPPAPRAPFAEAESLADLAPFEREGGSSDLVIEPVETGSAVRNSGRTSSDDARRSVIDEEALAPIARRTNRDLETIGDDYATVRDLRAAPQAERRESAVPRRPSSQPWLAPQFGSQEQALAPRRPVAPRQQEQVQRAPAERTGPDSDFTDAARDLLPERPREQTRLRSPSPVTPAPSATPPAPRSFGDGLKVPTASNKYPRPFQLLRPGIWPELQNPGVGLVQAPAPTPLPQFAAFAPPIVEPSGEAIQSASERDASSYTIKGGDNLLTIANSLGTTPQALAAANGLDLEAEIFIGQILNVPRRPATIATAPAVEVLDAPNPSFIGGPSVQTIDVAAANKARGHQPIQRASTQRYRVTTLGEPAPAPAETASANNSFDWPVHGNVYRLASGQVEIDTQGNAPVAASAAGRVVHVERGPMGVLVVIEHDNGWRSLTVGLDYSAVRPGDVVTQGKTIGKSSRDHRVRFELRDANTGRADTLAHLRG